MVLNKYSIIMTLPSHLYIFSCNNHTNLCTILGQMGVVNILCHTILPEQIPLTLWYRYSNSYCVKLNSLDLHFFHPDLANTMKYVGGSLT